jgi:hypothetical protein
MILPRQLESPPVSSSCDIFDTCALADCSTYVCIWQMSSGAAVGADRDSLREAAGPVCRGPPLCRKLAQKFGRGPFPNVSFRHVGVWLSLRLCGHTGWLTRCALPRLGPCPITPRRPVIPRPIYPACLVVRSKVSRAHCRVTRSLAPMARPLPSTTAITAGVRPAPPTCSGNGDRDGVAEPELETDMELEPATSPPTLHGGT